MLPWLKVEEVSGTFPGSYLLQPWPLGLSFLNARVVGIDDFPGVFGGLAALGIERMGCYALEGVDPPFVFDQRLTELGLETWCWVWLGCHSPIISFALWLD